MSGELYAGLRVGESHTYMRHIGWWIGGARVFIIACLLHLMTNHWNVRKT